MTTAAVHGFEGITGAESGKSSLFAINPQTGHILQRFDLSTAKAGLLGDMCVAADGTVYVTDSLGGGVYRVRGDLNTAHLEKIAGDFISPQTPVLSQDGKRLFVADYSLGIAVIDLNNTSDTRLHYLPHPETVAVTGIDGLYRFENNLIAIQNGTGPHRLMRFTLNPRQTVIISSTVIEQSISGRTDATHAVISHGAYYVSTNSGWDKVDDSGHLQKGLQFSPPLILRIPPPGSHPHSH